jgi:uncharacterized protein (DUF608 family)
MGGLPIPLRADVVQAYRRLIPNDKNLDSAGALRERGEPVSYSGKKALHHIGMPVGGLFCGTLYLGGDGRLWLWDVFNRVREGILPRPLAYKGRELRMRDGVNYISPPKPTHPFDQNFAITINGLRRTLDYDGFRSVTFRGRYPIGEVSYEDPTTPVSVTLEAFSPFIPLNTPDSSLPATVMRYRIQNTTLEKITVELSGWMENAICIHHRDRSGTVRNRVISNRLLTALHCSVDASGTVDKLHDNGTMTLAVLGRKEVTGSPGPGATGEEATAALGETLTGSVGQTVVIKPGQETVVTFVIAWHFPNLSVEGMQDVGREYVARFENAAAVASYVGRYVDRLYGETRLWCDTWYDSTLPYWFLDRTMANTSTLATGTAYRFKSGRFWAWEGVGCCKGTCTHVWHYAQAPGRLFPDVERGHREHVDFGLAMHRGGGIGTRADLTRSSRPAHDGHCGRILGAYREHQMSADAAFLKRKWPRIKSAIQFLIHTDVDGDGILNGAQRHTLDAEWYGKISFLSSLYLAALKAGEAMATEMGDKAFAARCKGIAGQGAQNILKLYNGEYFFHELDREHAGHVAAGTGCYIDQVFGQGWAHQVGLGYVMDAAKTKSALQALFKYNFVPNVGKFRETFTRGRWYAADDDAGLIMCSWPKGGLNPDWYRSWQFQYFNECMTGFEWQAASHMIWEGLIDEGMTVARAIHDRYRAEKRNPYNEVECSDHYARAMASYGAFLAASGYESHGPKAYLGFSPRISPERFKSAWTAAEGWGSYSQESRTGGQESLIHVKWGQLTLKTLGLDAKGSSVNAVLGRRKLRATLRREGKRAIVQLKKPVVIRAGEMLKVTVS